MGLLYGSVTIISGASSCREIIWLVFDFKCLNIMLHYTPLNKTILDGPQIKYLVR